MSGYPPHTVRAVEDKRPRSGKHAMYRALISVGEQRWVRFGKRAGNTNRAAVLRAFMDWYTREPGAKLPQRPAADD